MSAMKETRYTDEFRRDAVRIALISGLSRPKVVSGLGNGLSTLNKWVQKHQHDDLMSGPHEDIEKENESLRKEDCLLREEREELKKATIFFEGQNRRGLRLSKSEKKSGLSRYAGHIPWFPGVEGSPNEPAATR